MKKIMVTKTIESPCPTCNKQRKCSQYKDRATIISCSEFGQLAKIDKRRKV
jgi:hypothetical protein